MDVVFVIVVVAVVAVLAILASLLLPPRRPESAEDVETPIHGEVLETTTDRAIYFHINEEQVRSLYSQTVRSLRSNVHVERVQGGSGEVNLGLEGAGASGGIHGSTSTSYDLPDHSSLDKDFVANVVRRSVEIDRTVSELDLRVGARHRQIEQFIKEISKEAQQIGLVVPLPAIELIEAAWEEQDANQNADRLLRVEGAARVLGTFSVVEVPKLESASESLRLRQTVPSGNGADVHVEVLINWSDVRVSARNSFVAGEEVTVGCFGQVNKQPDQNVRILPFYSYWL